MLPNAIQELCNQFKYVKREADDGAVSYYDTNYLPDLFEKYWAPATIYERKLHAAGRGWIDEKRLKSWEAPLLADEDEQRTWTLEDGEIDAGDLGVFIGLEDLPDPANGGEWVLDGGGPDGNKGEVREAFVCPRCRAEWPEPWFIDGADCENCRGEANE